MRDRTNDYRRYDADGPLAASLLEYLALGGAEPSAIAELAERDLRVLHARIDCADFRAAYLIRVLYSFSDRLPGEVRNAVLRELLDFPYEDCGGHGMCTWTENHRLYLAGTEFLLAQSRPDALFGDGRDAAYHLARGGELLREFFSKTERYGFCEWGSNNYYSETMAGLANVAEFAGDSSLAEGAKRTLTMLLFDIFSRTAYHGGFLFNPACARAYADNKVSSRHGNYEETVLRAILGEDIRQFKEKEGCVILLLKARDQNGAPVFSVPEALLALLRQEEKESAIRQGVRLADYPAEGLDRYSPENVRYAFEAGALSDFRVIGSTMRYLRETGLIDNRMLRGLKPLASPFLSETGLLRLIKRFVTVPFDGAAMEEGRVYTYVNRDYSVSAAFDYRVGEPSFQQNSLAVNLSHEISLFANSPSYGPEKCGSPGYWIGSGTSPRAAAFRNVGACIFDVRHAKLGRKETHLFFPTGLFDRVELSGLKDGILFGMTGDVNVCVRTNPGAEFVPAEESLRADRALYQDEKLPMGCYDREYDLRNRAKGYHFYFFDVDNSRPFEEFRREMLEKAFTFDARTSALDYGGGAFRLSYRGAFEVNGRPFIPEFERPGRLLQEYMQKKEL